MHVKRINQTIQRLFQDLSVFLKIYRNQREILSSAKKGNIIIPLDCKPLVRGNIEHYYHFLFDLALPLSSLVKETSLDTVFSINLFGPLSEHLLKLFPGRVILDGETEQDEQQVLLGMNPIGLQTLAFNYDTLRKAAFKNLNIPVSTRPNKVLLIERVESDPYYLENTSKKGAGSVRRSIVNHTELEHLLRNELSDEFEFLNLVLEETSLEDQIAHFSNASLVIGQHGAGLANMIWMNQFSTVVEFGYQSRRHFKKISADKKHKYFEYKNFQEQHIEIDMADFHEWIKSQQHLNRFFRL